MLLPIAALLAVVPFVVRPASPWSAALATLCTLLLVAIRLLPLLVRLAGIALGKHIRGKTQQRRELLLARAEADEKEYSAKHKREDEDWEKVEGRSSGSSTPGGQDDRDWQGVVGFFHPFW